MKITYKPIKFSNLFLSCWELLHTVSGRKKTLCKQFYLVEKSYIDSSPPRITPTHDSSLKTPNKQAVTDYIEGSWLCCCFLFFSVSFFFSFFKITRFICKIQKETRTHTSDVVVRRIWRGELKRFIWCWMVWINVIPSDFMLKNVFFLVISAEWLTTVRGWWSTFHSSVRWLSTASPWTTAERTVKTRFASDCLATWTPTLTPCTDRDYPADDSPTSPFTDPSVCAITLSSPRLSGKGTNGNGTEYAA